MRGQRVGRRMDGLLMLLLFGVFAVCVLVVLMTGAKAYRGLVERDQAAFDRRTCVQYIATRVRQSDVEQGVSVEPFGEVEALALRGEEGLVTWVYCFDGYLMELYSFEDAELEPQDGEKIMPLAGLKFTLEDGLLTAEIDSGEGVVDTLRLFPRCGEGEAE